VVAISTLRCVVSMVVHSTVNANTADRVSSSVVPVMCY